MGAAEIAALIMGGLQLTNTLFDAWKTAKDGGELTPEHKAAIDAAQAAAQIANDAALARARQQQG